MNLTTEVIYPQYRKYKNNKSYFKIIAKDEFEEIQILGTNYTLHHFKAKILPDRNFISDMLFDYENHWDVIKEEEYVFIKTKTKLQ